MIVSCEFLSGVFGGEYPLDRDFLLGSFFEKGKDLFFKYFHLRNASVETHAGEC